MAPRISVLLLVLALVDGQPRDPVVWANEERTQAIFVPISFFETTPKDSAISLDQLRAMRADMLQRVPAQTERCVRAVVGDVIGGSERRSTAQRLADGEAAILGDVIAVTPGWNPHRRYATSLVTVRRDETFGSTEVEYEYITYSMDTASVAFGGGRLCTIDDTRTFVPRPGNRVLLVGRLNEHNPGHLDGTLDPVIEDIAIGSLCPLDESTFVPLRTLRPKEKR